MAKSALTRVKRAGVKNQVFEQLRNQIVSKAWPPGSKMPSENELARTLGVSRVSVREALQMLASLGLLQTRQGGGTFVKEYSGAVMLNPLFPMLALDKIGILDVLEYRRIVEKGTAALAAEKAGEKEIAELERLYAVMVERQGDAHAFAQADLEFHLALAKATGNPVIVKVNDIIKSILSASMDDIVHTLGTRDGIDYHGRLIAAVKARDAARAEKLMEEHVLRTITRLKKEKTRS
jgi:GntR family transcriptional regulator, transcriptional repressor for pyruvate dehydrogenase complex